METSEIPRNNYPQSSSDELENFGKDKINSLKENIKEIEEQLEQRKEIGTQFTKEGEKMKMSINNFLLENAPKGEDDSEFARERAELRRKSIEISEMQLHEKVECWRDVVLLKKDLREKQKELFERESRLDSINSIMEGN
ncbi:MAG: seryl-tRNA synthetase [Patescibacteria group bacterium]|jgi:seryl-tRNA synthetase